MKKKAPITEQAKREAVVEAAVARKGHEPFRTLHAVLARKKARCMYFPVNAMRFNSMEEPDALAAHVRICAGGASAGLGWRLYRDSWCGGLEGHRVEQGREGLGD
jgi:hypothetical protein